jgi:hypothetical protein
VQQPGAAAGREGVKVRGFGDLVRGTPAVVAVCAITESVK